MAGMERVPQEDSRPRLAPRQVHPGDGPVAEAPRGVDRDPVPVSTEGDGPQVHGPEAMALAGRRPRDRFHRPLRVLIVDDEYPARAELRFRLSQEQDVEITGEAANAREALRLIEALQYDVVFLDIAMPGLSGLDLAERLKHRQPPYVIFTTAYDDYAVQAFEARALDYLLKPFSDDRLKEALDRVRERLAGDEAAHRSWGRGPGRGEAGRPASAERSGPGADGAAASSAPSRPRWRPRWVMAVRDEAAVPIPVEELVYAEAENDQVFVYTGTQRYLTRYTLRELEELLPADRFFRCHRGYIVNLRKVREISPFFNGTYNLTVIHNGQAVTLPVARSRVQELKRHFWPEAD